MTMPDEILLNAMFARWATAMTLLSEPLRSDQSFIRAKTMPTFWPWPTNPKPEMVKTAATLSFSDWRKWSRTLASVRSVSSSEEPAGKET